MAKRTKCDGCIERSKNVMPACIRYHELLKKYPLVEAILVLENGCPYVQRVMAKVTTMADVVADKIKTEGGK